MLRVKGQFSNVDVDYNIKLHNKLYFTELVVWSAHKRVLHWGVNNTLNFIWNDHCDRKGRKTVRPLLKNRVTCKKSQSPLSPWLGGYYERLVRTVKSTLWKILGRSKLNFDELYTILTQVACMLNSRPLLHRRKLRTSNFASSFIRTKFTRTFI